MTNEANEVGKREIPLWAGGTGIMSTRTQGWGRGYKLLYALRCTLILYIICQLNACSVSVCSIDCSPRRGCVRNSQVVMSCVSELPIDNVLHVCHTGYSVNHDANNARLAQWGKQVSSKKQDPQADSKASVENEKTKLTREQIVEGYAIQVNGLTLDQYTEQIRESWRIGTQARLNVGRLLSIVVDNKMLDGVDITFADYVSDEFSIKPSMAYLLMRIWDDAEIRELVADHGMPLEAAGNALSMGTKYGAEKRKELVDYTLMADGTSKPASVLREKAKSIRKSAKLAQNPPKPAPVGPQAELDAVLSVDRVLRQQKKTLLGQIKEMDAKISVNSAEIARLTAIVAELADDAKPEPEPVNATRDAVKLADKHNVDLTNESGTLDNDRISVADVREMIKSATLDAKAKA